MRVAISASGEDLEAKVDSRFGRCQNILIVESESMEFESVPNENAMVAGGAGIQVAQTIIGKGVKAVITGNIGPNAYQILKAGGVKILTGASGTVREAVERFKKGELQETDSPTVGGHFGMRGMGRR